MKTITSAPDYKGFRFPPEMISHCVWLYVRFSLSFRDVEELLAERGIVITSETIRQWCLKCGQMYPNELRCRRPHCGDKWYLDEMVLTLRGSGTRFGGLWTRMATCSTSSFRADAIRKQPSDFFGISSKDSTTCRV
jgi:hypothetical protein